MADDELSEAKLRKLLRPRRRPPQPVTKGRQWVMTARDIDAFERVLRQRFPSIVFLEKDGNDPNALWRLVERPPFKRRFDAVLQSTYAVVRDRSDLGKRHEFRLESGEMIIGPYFRFGSCILIQYRSPARTQVGGNLGQGYLQGGHARSDRAAARFLARVWRVSEKISTNKVKEIDEDTGRTIWPRISGLWCGFDALRWCRESENRVLYWCYRPTDDWEMPDSPYYD